MAVPMTITFYIIYLVYIGYKIAADLWHDSCRRSGDRSYVMDANIGSMVVCPDIHMPYWNSSLRFAYYSDDRARGQLLNAKI